MTPPSSSVSLAIPAERIEQRILLIRKKKVILDRDLAVLYGVPTKTLNQAVKRNLERFPSDFMFQLSSAEFKNWKSQFVTSNSSTKMSLRKRPYAFTEQGIAMLSSVLRSQQAIHVNIAIMRTFVKLRELLTSHRKLARRIEELEKKYDGKFQLVFDAIRGMMAEPDPPPKKRIGFHTHDS